MQSLCVRSRRLAAVTASALLGLTLAISFGSPASAEEEPGIAPTFGDVSLASGLGPDSAGKTKPLTISVYGTVAAKDLKVRFDSTQVDKVLVTPPGSDHGCTTEDTVTTCTRAEVEPGEEFSLPFTFRVAPGAKPGDYDSFEFVFTAANKANETVHTAVARIVDSAPDLVAEQLTFTDVKPGSDIDVQPTVLNVGDTSTNGMVLHFADIRRYLSYVDEYANCALLDGFPVCLFPDAVLHPGGAYRLSAPLHFTVSKQVPWPRGTMAGYVVWPGDSPAAAAARKALAGKRGGKALTIVPAASTPRSLRDADEADNWGSVFVRTTRNPADLGVDGVKLSGKAGDTLPFTAVVTNHGPADTESRADSAPGTLSINAPSGTVFTAVYDECAPFIDGRPDYTKFGHAGYRSYHCLFSGGVLTVGDTERIPFTLKITEKSVGTDGWLEVHAGGVPDDTPKNNKAALLVKVGDGTTPSTSPSASASGGGGGSGDGAPLPTTGVSLPVYGAVGALLIAVGGGLYLLARRRRTATATAGTAETSD